MTLYIGKSKQLFRIYYANILISRQLYHFVSHNSLKCTAHNNNRSIAEFPSKEFFKVQSSVARETNEKRVCAARLIGPDRRVASRACYSARSPVGTISVDASKLDLHAKGFGRRPNWLHLIPIDVPRALRYFIRHCG